MPKKVKVELNSQGVRELLQSNEMMDICTEYANLGRSRLGDGYVVTNYRGKNRVNASIMAETPEAIKENLEKNTLLKALGGIK